MRLAAALNATLIGAALALIAPQAQAHLLCTLIADAATGKVLLQQGEDCAERVTPASTYKIAMSLMGFDSGFLQDEHAPVLDYHKGDVDWGGANWLKPTDPAAWIKYSVVWYSQRVTHHLGAEKVTRYARDFGFGNADMSGDPGQNNGLYRAWIASSLKISPQEQVKFLTRLVNGQLPVSAHALAMTRNITRLEQSPAGWDMHGKTGAAYPRLSKTDFDYAHGWGWFVGWATQDGRTLVFARLTRDDAENPVSPGIRTRDSVLADWPALLGQLR
ncbi:class D beta-lactamase [Silvimonas iriomotensis]|uniref:Beta-lactamase n=1 Tax=Silvimonas iriomotensis TaxID=449662 RepID=A0ABQ2PB48_9NEIS|nr:class D beta-lactamase [Silvimonas iriomotensis]GGP22767.1 beta-lactamase [Silvimonas iriomotensis]